MALRTSVVTVFAVVVVILMVPLIAEADLICDIEVEKEVDKAFAQIGEQVTFTVTVTNLGPDATTGMDIEILDAIGPDFDLIGSTPSRGSYDANTGYWVIGVMASSEVQTLELVVEIDEGVLVGGDVSNTASLNSPLGSTDPDHDNNSATASVHVTPEPVTAVLLAFGGLGVLAIRRSGRSFLKQTGRHRR